MAEYNRDWRRVYFAGPVSIDVEKAQQEKRMFLQDHYALLEQYDIHAHSPHEMHEWISGLEEHEGKDSGPEKYALGMCLDLVSDPDYLDAVVMLTTEEEESHGMQLERERAEALGTPIYSYPYFSTSNGELSVNEPDLDAFEALLQELRTQPRDSWLQRLLGR